MICFIAPQQNPINVKSLPTVSIAFNTVSYPDGVYFIKLSASDLGSNPPGSELRAEKTSSPLVIDNSLPVIQGLSAVRTGNSLDVAFQAVSGQMPPVQPSTHSPHSSQRSSEGHRPWKPPMEIVSIAGMQGIPTELYEAARVDGAESKWTLFWRITFPCCATRPSLSC
jgi:hypothetical protein